MSYEMLMCTPAYWVIGVFMKRFAVAAKKLRLCCSWTSFTAAATPQSNDLYQQQQMRTSKRSVQQHHNEFTSSTILMKRDCLH
jgi:hypothetical protein